MNLKIVQWIFNKLKHKGRKYWKTQQNETKTEQIDQEPSNNKSQWLELLWLYKLDRVPGLLLQTISTKPLVSSIE